MYYAEMSLIEWKILKMLHLVDLDQFETETLLID